MTHVGEERIKAMLRYKQLESENNSEVILTILDDMSIPLSSTEIKKHIDQQALRKAKAYAERKYHNDEISSQEFKEYVTKHSKAMDLRTVQRWLTKFVQSGIVEKKYNKYSLSESGRRHLRFREFARSYGLIALNNIMNCYFPTIYTVDQNLKKLVEIFGTYIVYCLIEAARLVMSNKTSDEEHWHSSYFGYTSNFKNGKFKEKKFVDSWIKDVFSPWHMLNLFLVSTLNANKSGRPHKNSTVREDEEETILQEYSKQYEGFDLSKISRVPIDSILPANIKKKENNRKAHYTALDLMLKRFAETSSFPQFGTNYSSEMSLEALMQNKRIYNFFKSRNQYNENHLLYELDSKKIEELKNSLKQQYPLHYKCLQKTDDLFYKKQV